MQKHDHYHEISADTPRDMGLALGRAFGPALAPFLKRLAPLPDAQRAYLRDCIAFTREVFPDYAAEMDGYAAGAGAEAETLWHMMLEDDISAFPHEKCTSFATNNGRLVGHNEDWTADAALRLFLLRRNLAGSILFELHYAGTPGGNAVSINGQGVVNAVNSQEATPVDASTPRVPTNIVARFLAESADIPAALERLKSIPRMGGYAHTFVQGKSARPHCLAELSQHVMAAQDIAQFPFVHANHYVLESMTPYNGGASDGPTSTRKRYAAAQRGAKAQMTADDAKMLLEDRSGGPSCGLMNARTIGSVVFDLDGACAHVRLTREAEKGWLRYELDFL